MGLCSKKEDFSGRQKNHIWFYRYLTQFSCLESGVYHIYLHQNICGKDYLKITCGDKKDCKLAKIFDKIFLNIHSQNLDLLDSVLKNKNIVDLSDLEERSFSKLKKNCERIVSIFLPSFSLLSLKE